MSCIPKSLTIFNVPCDPAIGGIESIQIGTSYVSTIVIGGNDYERDDESDSPGSPHPYAYVHSSSYAYFNSVVPSVGDNGYTTAVSSTIVGAVTAVIPNTPHTWVYESFDVVPEKSNFTSTYSYDKLTNVGLWTTTITIFFGEYTEDVEDFLANLHYRTGRPFKFKTKNGINCSVENAIWTGGEVNPGTAYTDAQNGTLTFTAVNKVPITVISSN